MSTSRKVIKAISMVFAVYLFVMIVTGITTVVVMGMKITLRVRSENSINFTQNFKDIKYVTVENSRVSVSILPTDEESIKVTGSHVPDAIKVEKVGEELVIKNPFYYEDLFNWFSDESEDSNITVLIPKDTRLLKVDVENGSGRLEVRDMNVDEFILDGGSGDITMSGIVAKEHEFDLGSGSFSAKESKFVDGEWDSGSGKIHLEECTISDTQFELGSGAVEFNGTLLGDNSFDGGSGDLTMELDQKITDYNLDIDLGSGNGYINEKRIEDDYCMDYADGHNTITIDGGSGKINLNFMR